MSGNCLVGSYTMATTTRDSTLHLFKTLFWHCCLRPHSNMNPSERSATSQDLPQSSSQRVEIPKSNGLHGSKISELALPQECNVRTAPAHLKRIGSQKTIQETRGRWHSQQRAPDCQAGREIMGVRVLQALSSRGTIAKTGQHVCLPVREKDRQKMQNMYTDLVS